MSKPRPWTAADDEYLRRHYGQRAIEDLVVTLGRTFTAILSRAKTLRLGQREFWTAEADAILRRDYPAMETRDLARALGRSVQSIYDRAQRLKLTKSHDFLATQHARAARRLVMAGQRSQFQTGQMPWNAGRKGECAEGCQATQFRPGNRPHSWKPIGHERISREGYLERKITDDGPTRRHYVGVHRLLWIEANGPIPTGHIVVFQNGNPRDLHLGNLELITRHEHLRRNSLNRYPQALKDIIYARAALTRAINRLTREQDQP